MVGRAGAHSRQVPAELKFADFEAKPAAKHRHLLRAGRSACGDVGMIAIVFHIVVLYEALLMHLRDVDVAAVVENAKGKQ